MAVIWDERFEGAGREETWSLGEVVAGGATIDEDAASSLAGSPSGWGTSCNQHVAVAANTCYLGHQFAAQAVTFTSFEAVVTAESLADNAFMTIGSAFNATPSALWTVLFQQLSGVTYSVLIVQHDTTAQVISTIAWPLNTRRRFEVNWNSTADTWQAWVDGLSVGSGTLTGGAETRTLVYLLMGVDGATSGAGTFYIDRVFVDDANRAGLSKATGNTALATGFNCI